MGLIMYLLDNYKKTVVFGERRVLCKMPRRNPLGELFVLSRTCGVSHHVKRHIHYSYTCQEALPPMIMST